MAEERIAITFLSANMVYLRSFEVEHENMLG
jgi:hypothetical protein